MVVVVALQGLCQRQFLHALPVQDAQALTVLAHDKPLGGDLLLLTTQQCGGAYALDLCVVQANRTQLRADLSRQVGTRQLLVV